MSEVSVACKYAFKSFKIQDPDNLLEIKPFQAELEKCRTSDVQFVVTSVNEIRSDLESLKTDVSNMEENRTDYLRRKMYDIEEKIAHFKEVIKEELLNLLKDEVNLSKDIRFAERRSEEWGKPVNDKIFKPFKKQTGSKVPTESHNPTTEFHKFLSAFGGHYGGWEEQDHLLFLRERNKFKGNDKFLTVVHSLLPDLSFDVIEEHEKWYCKYEELKKCQKEAIKKWREEKREERIKKEKEREETKVEERKEMKKTVRQQINIAERIKEWKNQQLVRKLEEEKRQKKEKEKLKEEEKRKKELQERKKLAVSQYKAEKLKKTSELFPKDEQKLFPAESKTKNNLLLKSFRLQDLKFIEKKKIIRLQIESKANEKLSRWRMAKPALEFILQRDPQRVFQPTLIWNQHCLEAQKREKIDPVFDLNSIPRLAIPEWRRELK